MFSFRFCLVKLTTVIFYNILLPRALQSYQAAAHRNTQSIDLLQITEALTCWLLILDSCYSMDVLILLIQATVLCLTTAEKTDSRLQDFRACC